jgi:hypothetical protein
MSRSAGVNGGCSSSRKLLGPVAQGVSLFQDVA